MHLLIIVICLGIERVVNPGLFINRYSWLTHYMQWLQKLLPEAKWWQGYRGVFLLLIPLLLSIGLVAWLTASILAGFFYFILSLGVLFYCLGPHDSRRQIEGYLAAKQQGDEEMAAVWHQSLQQDDQEDGITLAAVKRFNRELFAVVFWFALLGPVGAILYRVASLLAQASEQLPESTLKAAKQLLKILDWLPIRLAALSAALVWDYKQYRQSALTAVSQTSFKDNSTILKQLTRMAQDDNELTVLTRLLRLFDRVLLFWLAVVAVFTLVSLFF